MDLCNVGNIFPLNHLSRYNKTFPGVFTYHNNVRKSQIDFVLINKKTIDNISMLHFPPVNWHLSDHRPICISAKFMKKISLNHILKRAADLNTEKDTIQTFKRHRGNYQYEKI